MRYQYVKNHKFRNASATVSDLVIPVGTWTDINISNVNIRGNTGDTLELSLSFQAAPGAANNGLNITFLLNDVTILQNGTGGFGVARIFITDTSQQVWTVIWNYELQHSDLTSDGIVAVRPQMKSEVGTNTIQMTASGTRPQFRVKNLGPQDDDDE